MLQQPAERLVGTLGFQAKLFDAFFFDQLYGLVYIVGNQEVFFVAGADGSIVFHHFDMRYQLLMEFSAENDDGEILYFSGLDERECLKMAASIKPGPPPVMIVKPSLAKAAAASRVSL
jgi:hypothetical protein